MPKTHNLNQINARQIDARHELFALRPDKRNPKRVVFHERQQDDGFARHIIRFADGFTRVLSDEAVVWEGKELSD